MDHSKAAVDRLYDNADRDQELRNWFKLVNQYARKVLLQPGFVLEPACNNEAREIREQGRRFYDEKYKDDFDNLFRVCLLLFAVKGVRLMFGFRLLVTGSRRWAKTL